MDSQQISWPNVGIRMVQGLTTTIDAIRQLDAQEASLVMRLLGKTCTKMMNEGVGHQFGIALIETSAQLAMKESLVVEDVLKIITSIIGRLYFTAQTEEERLLVAQLEETVRHYNFS
ncbi:MAG: recombinase [Desulfitobacteriaceae bacterium]